jgi:hypothetical protein
MLRRSLWKKFLILLLLVILFQFKSACRVVPWTPPRCSLAYLVSQLHSWATLVLSALIPCPSLSTLAPSDYPNFLPFVHHAFPLVFSADIHISPLSSLVTFNPIVWEQAKDSIWRSWKSSYFIQISLLQRKKNEGSSY